MYKTEGLTNRQLQVLAEYASGNSVIEISQRIFLSHHTVANYMKAAKKKTDAKTTAQLVAWCISEGRLRVVDDGSVVVSTLEI